MVPLDNYDKNFDAMTGQDDDENEEKTEATTARQRVFRRDEMAAWDLLQRPIWVFDSRRNRMWWANESGLELWNAKSRDELLARDYSDSSESVKLRAREVMARVERGELFNEQWTIYPRGKATTVIVGHSGIMIEDDEDGGPPYMAMVNEGLATLSMDDEVAAEGLRSIEMIRHLPEPVAQFDSNGTLVTQNPEALKLFGKASFVERFTDMEVGRDLLKTLHEKGFVPHNSMQVQQKTIDQGSRWFDVQVRSRSDPVTAGPSILYAARDISLIMESEAKSELLSVIAHEIRTPLHTLNGFTELLERTELDEHQKEYVSMVKHSCVCMMGVINDVLDFGKVESGKLHLESIPFELQSVASGTVAAITPIAEKKGLEVDSHFDAHLPNKVVGDPSRFRQVLSNLLNNAVKFTETGRVSVSLSSIRKSDGRDHVLVSVEDTGIGIKPEGQALLFQKYRQVHDVAASRKYGGTGLGLAISKNLVELMGGTIGVDSVVNKGSKFWFCIPFTPVCHPSALGAPTKHSSTTRNNFRWSILVAEDDKVCQKLAASMLHTLGHSVTLVDDGRMAVNEVLRSGHRFDLVLMDVQMPNLDGLGATRQIRHITPSLQTLPIVGLTADFLPSEMSKYTAAGMNSCLGKPIRLETLRTCIQDLQSQSEVAQQ